MVISNGCPGHGDAETFDEMVLVSLMLLPLLLVLVLVLAELASCSSEKKPFEIRTSLSAVYQGYTNQAVWSPARWGLGAWAPVGFSKHWS